MGKYCRVGDSFLSEKLLINKRDGKEESIFERELIILQRQIAISRAELLTKFSNVFQIYESIIPNNFQESPKSFDSLSQNAIKFQLRFRFQ